MWGLPSWLSGKEPGENAGDSGLILGSEKSSGKETDNLLQYSCLGNPMDREVRQATVHGGTESYMTEAT